MGNAEGGATSVFCSDAKACSDPDGLIKEIRVVVEDRGPPQDEWMPMQVASLEAADRIDPWTSPMLDQRSYLLPSGSKPRTVPPQGFLADSPGDVQVMWSKARDGHVLLSSHEGQNNEPAGHRGHYAEVAQRPLPAKQVHQQTVPAAALLAKDIRFLRRVKSGPAMGTVNRRPAQGLTASDGDGPETEAA